MSQPRRTLKEYLKGPNPRVVGIERKTSSSVAVTTNNNWIFPFRIKRWKRFRLDASDAIYSKALEEVLDSECQSTCDCNDFSRIEEFPFCDIRDENSLDALLSVSIQSRVTKALKFAQNKLQGQTMVGESRHRSIYVSVRVVLQDL